jgi:myosin heavy subunit
MLDDAADFGRVDRGLASIGLDQEERFSVYTTIAAVLHLGNIEFQVSKVNILYENLYIKKPTSIATSFELYPFQYVNTSPTPHLTRPTRK